MLIIVPPVIAHQVAEQNTLSEQFLFRIWQDKSEQYSIEWTSRNIIARKQNHTKTEQIFNLEDCVSSVFEKHRQRLREEAENVGRCDFALYYKITSIVGRYLCLHEQFWGKYEATKPTSQKTFRTIDISKSAKNHPPFCSLSDYEASLTDIVSEQALIRALWMNPFIQQAFRATCSDKVFAIQKDTSDSMKRFIDTLQTKNIFIEDAKGNRNYSFGIDLKNFVIHHLSDGVIGVKILLPNPTILADKPLQLDLNIHIPHTLQNALGKADTKKAEDFLMDKRAPVLNETTTMFRRTLFPPYHEFTPS